MHTLQQLCIAHCLMDLTVRHSAARRCVYCSVSKAPAARTDSSACTVLPTAAVLDH